MSRGIERSENDTRRELELALTEIDSSEGRYHIRQALQLLEAEN